MNSNDVERLAAAVNALRPDWPVRSLITFITRDLGHRAVRDAAVALAWIACDPDTQTPKRVLEQGPWWTATAAAADRPVVVAGIGELCHHCGCTRFRCQSDVMQHQDPHQYRTAYDAAVERARSERRQSEQPPLREWKPTDAAGPGGRIPAHHRSRLEAGIAEGRTRFAAHQAALDEQTNQEGRS
jgi:hypothetical protein